MILINQYNKLKLNIFDKSLTLCNNNIYKTSSVKLQITKVSSYRDMREYILQYDILRLK